MSASNLPSPELLRHACSLLAESPSLGAADLVLKLRRSFPDTPPSIVALAAETAAARITAREKLGEWSERGLFTTAVLEQASRGAIAEYRARFFQGRKHVLEIGTGTGSDTTALARVSGHVTTIESDPVRSEAARHNLSVQGVTNVTLLSGDAESIISELDLSQFDALFADPARRDRDGARIRKGEDYAPSLRWLMELGVGTLRAIKVGPGLFCEPPPTGWIRQFVGVGAECLEQTLWYGSPIKDSSVYLADCQVGWSPCHQVQPGIVTTLEGFIVEAHGTLNRCQHLHEFFAEHDIQIIAPDIAYGIASTLPNPTPLLSTFRIIEAFPHNLKKLKESLLRLGWTNRTEIKKRNFPGDPEEVRSALHLPPHAHNAPFGTIFLFKWHSKTWVVLAQRQ